VLFGVMLIGEHVGPLDLVGMAVILCGVAIVILARGRKRALEPTCGR
jgi:drug/metabolite transporter (DMT)-like permease